MGLLKRGTVESTMYVNRLVKIASVVTVAAFVSAAALPAFAGNCGNGRGDGNAKCATGSVAPLPALGTGLPGLIVLAGGLLAIARRRRR
jgi:hypothetical protein